MTLSINDKSTAGASDQAAAPTTPDPEGLTPQERLFVRAYYREAKYNATRAAQLAGYSTNSRGGLRVTGWRLMHRPRVRLALRTEYRLFREREAKRADRRVEGD